MFRQLKISMVTIGVCLSWFGAEASLIDINDGGYHEINWSKPWGYADNIHLDWGYPGVGTKAKVVSGARIASIYGGGDSIVTLEGGEVFFSVGVSDRSAATITGGVMGHVIGAGKGNIIFSGGLINGDLESYVSSKVIIQGGTMGNAKACGASTIDIYGGQIDWGIYAIQDSIITIWGSKFSLDGISVSYGPITATSGTITGTLSSGEIINVPFDSLDNASIILVPEPASVLLLGLGGLFLRRKARL